MDSASTIAKAQMRRVMRARRRLLAKDRESASRQAADLAPLDRWRSEPVVAGYLAMPTEIDPAPLLRRLAAAGARIVLPVVVARGAPLIFRRAGPAADLRPDAAGLPAPPSWAEALDPTLVITPLLAFDGAGGRLGQGGGYYDRTLRWLRGRGPLIAVGFAFSGQQVELTPMDEDDARLDAILTETGYIEV